MGISQQYVPHIVSFLIENAPNASTVTYGQVAEHVGRIFNRSSSARAMGKPLYRIKEICQEHGWPELTALVVQAANGLPGEGLFEGLGDLDASSRKAKFRTMLERVRAFDWSDAKARYGA